MLAAVALATAALSGCSDKSMSAPVPRAAERCPVTLPGGKVPSAAPKGFDHGNRSLGVALWPGGELVAGRLPDGSSYAEVMPDGGIAAKLGWWRGAIGELTIRGERLDASAPPLRADIPDGYGRTGFQATGVIFPTEGCWKVVGSVGRASLTFVVLVRDR